MRKKKIISALLVLLLLLLALPLEVYAATTYQAIKLRRGTAAAWTAANPVLADGEPGYATDTQILKIGDGLTHWEDLPSISAGGDGGTTTSLPWDNVTDKPAFGTAALQNVGTLTNGRYCTYVTGTGIVCASEVGESGAINWDNVAITGGLIEGVSSASAASVHAASYVASPTIKIEGGPSGVGWIKGGDEYFSFISSRGTLWSPDNVGMFDFLVGTLGSGYQTKEMFMVRIDAAPPANWLFKSYGNGDFHTAGNIVPAGITLDGETITSWDNLVVSGVGDDLGDATSADVATLFSGSGDYLKSDGTRGTPSGAGTGTTISILKGDGAGGFDNAIAGTDYATPAALESKQDGSAMLSDLSDASLGSDLIVEDSRGIKFGTDNDIVLRFDPALDKFAFMLDNVSILGTISKAGVLQFNEVYADLFSSTCNPADNECYVNAYNAGSPAQDNVGTCGFSGAGDAWGCWTTSGFVTYGTGSGGTIPAGDDVVVDAAGEIAVDTTADTDQFLYYTSAVNVLTPLETKGFTIYSPTADHRVDFKLLGQAWTLRTLACKTDTGTIAVDLQECGSDGTSSCATTGLSVTADSDGEIDAVPSDASVAANAWLLFVMSSPSGTPGRLSCSWAYTVTRQ
jgi:hypothetical protein